MERIEDFTALEQIPSSYLNEHQDRTTDVAWVNGLIPGGITAWSTDGAAVYISRIPNIILALDPDDPETFRSFDSGTLITLSPTLTANRLHYVYGYVDAGSPTVLSVEVTQTAPSADGVWKDGAFGTHRYLCALKATAGAAVLPFRKRGGRVTYDLSGVAATEARALNDTATYPTTFTYVQAAHDDPANAGNRLVPPHARSVGLRWSLYTNGAYAYYVEARSYGQTAGVYFVTPYDGNGGRTTDTFDMVLGENAGVPDSSYGLEYRFNTGAPPAGSTLTVHVTGYDD